MKFTQLSWLLTRLLQKPDGYGLAQKLQEAIDKELKEYEPQNEHEYE